MIQLRPKLKNKKLIAISLSLLILAVLLFPIASLAGKYASLVQIFAIASAAVSLFILIKYVVPDYLYTVENGHFIIHKITKSQSICVADIELSQAKTGLLTAQEYKSLNKTRKVFTFLKNPFSEEVRYIVFSDGCDEYAVQFETDDFFENEFSKILNSIENDEEE